jgi:hypothetical protein
MLEPKRSQDRDEESKRALLSHGAKCGISLTIVGLAALTIISFSHEVGPAVREEMRRPANWNVVAPRFQALRPWGPEPNTLENSDLRLPVLNASAVIHNLDTLTNMSQPAAPRFDSNDKSNYVYHPPYETGPPRTGVKDSTHDAKTQLTLIEPEAAKDTGLLPAELSGKGSTAQMIATIGGGSGSGSGGGGGGGAMFKVFQVPGPDTSPPMFKVTQAPTEANKWDEGSWTDCSVTCGKGAKMRIVTCRNKAGVSLPSSACQGSAPKDHEFCNKSPCPTPPPVQDTAAPTAKPEYEWKLGPMSECSVTCGSGAQMALAFCIDSVTQRSVESSKCANTHSQKKVSEHVCAGVGLCP